MIEIDIKSKRFPAIGKAGQHLAIADFRLNVSPDEFVCLVGPSGCGKTSLLNIIAGLDQDYIGKVRVGQSDSATKIGYVFQNPRLLPWRTVRENIELVIQDNSSSSYVDSFLEIMQLSEFQHAYPGRLSLGMSRRVAIIRAFAINPDLLLMDEPFVSLDGQSARQARALLLKLWQQRPHMVIFVTHDLREAIALADRIVFLTPAPMRVITETKVTLPRDERNNEQAVEAYREQVLRAHPDLR